MTFYLWSRVKDTNNTADSTCPFPEGQSPSSLNDGSRGQMAALAKFRDDISGAILTGGTSGAYTVSSYQGFDSLAHLHGQMIGFTPHTSNVDTVLLNVDGLGSKPLRSAPGVELVKGTLVLGTPYVAVYNNTDGVFYLRGFYSSPYNVPFLGGIDHWDTVTPNSAFIFPIGQALSRTVYSAAFAKWGTAFGAGDGSTTFNAPDKRGRFSAAADNMGGSSAGRISANFGGITGGASVTLAQVHLPAVTLGITGNVTVTTTNQLLSSNAQVSAFGAASGSGQNWNAFAAGSTQVVTFQNSTGSITSGNTASMGSSQAFSVLPPVIACNYIIRIL